MPRPISWRTTSGGLGVKPDTLVAICVERSLGMVIGLLGILKAGGAYVPLDPDYPGQRLEFMLQDSAAPLLLTQAHLKERLPSTDTRIVWLDSAWDEIGRCAEDNLPTVASPLNLAYCIYTSGSTGKPKAVGGTHIALCNRLSWAASQFARSPNDRHLQKTSLNFVDSITETCTPLITGSTLCIAPQGARDPDQLCRYVSRFQISHIVVVPSLLKVLLLENRERQLRSLRQIVCSGESLRHDLRAEAERLLPSAVLVNLYGSSEVAGDVTFCTGGLGAFTETASSSIIGHPISNTRVYLLDASMSPAPVGVPAAIYVGGIATARGYLGRPDLTAANFIPDPYSADPDARMYTTGDLGRYRTDGSIEYLGRMDHQVKVRGFSHRTWGGGGRAARLQGCARRCSAGARR
jgi:amino acid adenylation domain-containing protein